MSLSISFRCRSNLRVRTGSATLWVEAVRSGELRAPRPHGLDFPALEHETGLEPFFDEVVITRAPVLGDHALGGFGLGHDALYRARAVACVASRAVRLEPRTGVGHT